MYHIAKALYPSNTFIKLEKHILIYILKKLTFNLSYLWIRANMWINSSNLNGEISDASRYPLTFCCTSCQTLNKPCSSFCFM